MVPVGLSVQRRGLVCDRLRREKVRKKRKIGPSGINRRQRIGIQTDRRNSKTCKGNRFKADQGMRSGLTTLFLLILLIASSSFAQSRHSDRGTANVEGTVLNVTALREDGKADAIKIEQLFLYENGVEQKIKNFSFDPSPSRILILVDNSQTLPT